MHHGYQSTIDSVEKSLQDLQTDYIDVFLIHTKDCNEGYFKCPPGILLCVFVSTVLSTRLSVLAVLYLPPPPSFVPPDHSSVLSVRPFVPPVFVTNLHEGIIIYSFHNTTVARVVSITVRYFLSTVPLCMSMY